MVLHTGDHQDTSDFAGTETVYLDAAWANYSETINITDPYQVAVYVDGDYSEGYSFSIQSHPALTYIYLDSFNLGTFAKGDYYVEVFLGAEEEMTETDEDNHYRRKDFSVGRWQPDLWVKHQGSWLGNDLYNDDGTDQTSPRTVGQETTQVYRARVYNDGTETETFWVQGTAGDADWTVRYYRGTQVKEEREVTRWVTRAQGWKRADVSPGGRGDFLITVTSGPHTTGDFPVVVVARSDRFPSQLYSTQIGFANFPERGTVRRPAPDKANSQNLSSGRIDCIQAVTTVPNPQPDLWIKGDVRWKGDDVYNEDGTDQTRSRRGYPGGTVVYRAHLENDPYKEANPILNTNLISNGNAETGDATGWTVTQGTLVAEQYGIGEGFPGPTDPGPPKRGSYFFYGRTATGATQSVDISSGSRFIDEKEATYSLEGYLGGYRDHEDGAALKIRFLDTEGQPLGEDSIGPVSADDRGHQTGLFLRTTTGPVPEGARRIDLELELTSVVEERVIPVGDSPYGVAITPDGATAVVTHRFDDTVGVVDLATGAMTDTIPVEYRPAGVALTPDGADAVVTHPYRDTVSVVDLATDTVTATIPVGDYPYGIAPTPDGADAVVTHLNDDTVGVVDLATGAMTDTIPVGYRPIDVAVTPDGATAVVTNGYDDTISVVDLATQEMTLIAVGDYPYGIALTPDGATAVVVNHSDDTVSVVDLATGTVTATIPVGAGPMDVAVTPDGAAVTPGGGDDTVSVLSLISEAYADNLSLKLTATGGETETFRIKGPVGDENWTVRYYRGTQVREDREVTDQVTSETGWKRVMAPDQPHKFLMTVTPSSGLAAGERYEALIRAESQHDPHQCDVLKAVMTVK